MEPTTTSKPAIRDDLTRGSGTGRHRRPGVLPHLKSAQDFFAGRRFLGTLSVDRRCFMSRCRCLGVPATLQYFQILFLQLSKVPFRLGKRLVRCIPRKFGEMIGGLAVFE